MKSNTHEKSKSLISNHPFFSVLTDSEVNELAKLAFKKKYPAKQIIVTQGDLIDSVYLIAEGEIEVATEISPQAILHEGEAIGLTKTGFFSPSGMRTATLTTLTETTLIGWNLSDFHQFLQTHSVLTDSMKSSAEKWLQMNFIKQAVPFTDLSFSQIAWLANQVEHVSATAGTIIFHEGEIGDKCYLIKSGKVEILLNNADGTMRSLTILESSILFGETALLTASPRNATARVIEDAELLAIQKHHLQELIKSHVSATESLMTLMIERARPMRLLNVTEHHRKTPDGQKIVILKNNKLRRYFQLSEEGWFVWQNLDGKQTLQDITIGLYKKKRIFVPEAVADTIFNLEEAGFVSLPTLTTSNSEEKPIAHKKFSHFRIILNNIDEKITQSYKSGIYLLFAPVVNFMMASVAIIGLILFGTTFNTVVPIIKSIEHPFLLVGLLIIANLGEVILHELGHAYATKAHKHEVHGAEIVISWFGLVAFVDTSDMWLSEKRSRIIVNLAGVYVDMIIAGIASFIAFFVTQLDIVSFFWLFALTLYCSVFKNLNPLYENDGYYILKDVFNNSKLRIKAFNWLLQLHIKPKRSIVYYWLSCLVFFVVALLFAIILQHYLRIVLPYDLLGISTWHLTWILPAWVIINFVMNIFMPLRLLSKNSMKTSS